MNVLFARSNTDLHAAHVMWLAANIGHGGIWDIERTTSMGVYDGDLIAVVVYHEWSPQYGTIAMSAASTSRKWLNREVLYRMHEYPFDQVDCQAVVLQVSEHNTPMLRIAKSYGYEQHRIPRLRGRNEAEIVNILTEETWRENAFTKSFVAKSERVG